MSEEEEEWGGEWGGDDDEDQDDDQDEDEDEDEHDDEDAYEKCFMCETPSPPRLLTTVDERHAGSGSGIPWI